MADEASMLFGTFHVGQLSEAHFSLLDSETYTKSCILNINGSNEVVGKTRGLFLVDYRL